MLGKDLEASLPAGEVRNEGNVTKLIVGDVSFTRVPKERWFDLEVLISGSIPGASSRRCPGCSGVWHVSKTLVWCDVCGRGMCRHGGYIYAKNLLKLLHAYSNDGPAEVRWLWDGEVFGTPTPFSALPLHGVLRKLILLGDPLAQGWLNYAYGVRLSEGWELISRERWIFHKAIPLTSRKLVEDTILSIYSPETLPGVWKEYFRKYAVTYACQPGTATANGYNVEAYWPAIRTFKELNPFKPLPPARNLELELKSLTGRWPAAGAWLEKKGIVTK